jgi:uncharacterized membrane protein YbhN (UPF0104 family)
MGKIKSMLYKFMYGRYGTDTLGNVMLISYIVITLLYTFIGFFVSSVWFDIAVWILSSALVIMIVCRLFSRKIAKRRKENEKFCGFFRLRKNKFKDRKTHVYRKCPKCKAVLRLPKAKGKHTVVCPRCKERFTVKG